LDELTLLPENDILSESEVKFQQVCANATILARNLANARGSVGHPQYMEDAMKKVVEGQDIKELRILDHE
jgi:leucyl aminopeptidase